MTSRPGNARNPSHEASARRFVVVHVRGRQRGQLEEGRTWVDQPIDSFADRHLSLLAVTLQVFRAAALAGTLGPLAQFSHELLHPVADWS